MKCLCFLLMIISVLSLNAQDFKTQKVKTTPASVVVYLDGAEVTCEQNVSLSVGRNMVVFENLSPRFIDNSLRITVPVEYENDISILSISGQVDYLSSIDEKPRVRQIRDSLKNLESSITSLKDEQNALNIEREMLLKNQQLGSQNDAVSVIELKQAADFFRERIKEINFKISAIALNMNDLAKTQNRLESELQELNAELTYERGKVSVMISSKKQVAIPVELKYRINEAGWSPVYDIKASELDKPVNLIYRALVYNDSRINWDNVKIKLSTADPRLTASQPVMKPWYLNFEQYRSVSNMFYDEKMKMAEGYAQNRMVQQSQINVFDDVYKAEVEKEFVEVEISEFSSEFTIPVDYTIPADNKPYIVEVAKFELPAQFKHYAAPKLDRDAFLIAQITGWEDLNLVAGPANIYFSGTFIGRSYINTRNVKDTLDISMGRDKKIIVTRTKVKEYSSTSFIGSTRTENLTFEMVVKNNRKSNIDITLNDQVPVSQSDDIKVEVIDISSASRNDLTGELTWKLQLKPGESKKLKLSFNIKYPKNRQVSTQQIQKRSVRKF